MPRCDVKFVRDLLKEYLTDPPYAAVKEINPNQLVVQLPDGGGCFLIAVYEQENQGNEDDP
jgi:hypothetical protein